ncbi:MAG: DHHA1 domain-containing protein [Anaerolineae bacterium]|nr:DHHA1 domain-containing protein [Anaerolineae bacterium]
MTGRLYYDEPHLTRFSARVVEQLEWDGQPAVVLDRTAFYPTGGGQPHDTGSLDGVQVQEVVERAEDGAVVHILTAPLEAEQVEAEVDWQRRFDLMQQHTGQHILSAASVAHLGANTVGFHLADDYATIDLDQAPLTAAALAEVEALANDVVFEDRPVVARFVPDEEVPSLALRKPLAHEGPVRIVEIPGFDTSACGGTHVGSTGAVGLIKITRSERRGDETRVEFLCGRRALYDYQAKNTLLMDLAREYTVAHWQVGEMVHRLADELKEVRRALRVTRDALLDAQASALWHEAVLMEPARVVRAHLPEGSPEDLKHLAQRLVSRPGTVALLAAGGTGEEKGYFVFARSDDLRFHMGNLLRQACEVVGGGGGGRPEFAQGGGPAGAPVAEGLDVAFQALVESIS